MRRLFMLILVSAVAILSAEKCNAQFSKLSMCVFRRNVGQVVR